MADSEDKDQKQASGEDQDTRHQSTILGLAEQLLAEADRLARGVREDAEREAEAQAATIVGEAERRAEDIVAAAGEKAKLLESEAHKALRSLSDRVRAELESSVSALNKLTVTDGDPEIGATQSPQGMGHTQVGEAPKHPKPPRLQGYDLRGQVSRASNANGAS